MISGEVRIGAGVLGAWAVHDVGPRWWAGGHVDTVMCGVILGVSYEFVPAAWWVERRPSSLLFCLVTVVVVAAVCLVGVTMSLGRARGRRAVTVLTSATTASCYICRRQAWWMWAAARLGCWLCPVRPTARRSARSNQTAH